MNSMASRVVFCVLSVFLLSSVSAYHDYSSQAHQGFEVESYYYQQHYWCAGVDCGFERSSCCGTNCCLDGFGCCTSSNQCTWCDDDFNQSASVKVAYTVIGVAVGTSVGLCACVAMCVFYYYHRRYRQQQFVGTVHFQQDSSTTPLMAAAEPLLPPVANNNYYYSAPVTQQGVVAPEKSPPAMGYGQVTAAYPPPPPPVVAAGNVVASAPVMTADVADAYATKSSQV